MLVCLLKCFPAPSCLCAVWQATGYPARNSGQCLVTADLCTSHQVDVGVNARNDCPSISMTQKRYVAPPKTNKVKCNLKIKVMPSPNPNHHVPPSSWSFFGGISHFQTHPHKDEPPQTSGYTKSWPNTDLASTPTKLFSAEFFQRWTQKSWRSWRGILGFENTKCKKNIPIS